MDSARSTSGNSLTMAGFHKRRESNQSNHEYRVDKIDEDSENQSSKASNVGPKFKMNKTG